jgi:predicted glycosyltransferase
MKILVGVSHPKHVYMFKNFICKMIESGHEVKIAAVEREGITEYLLKRFNLPYELIGETQSGIFRKALCLPKWDYITFKIAKKFRPDIYIGQAHVNLAHVTTLLRKPFILFEDTESATVLQRLCLPFTDVVVTPSCYKCDFGRKHLRFNGYYELAYLHPNYFKPDPAVLDELGLSKDDRFIILRFASWDALHDIGQHGFNFKNEQELSSFVSKLENYGVIFIQSEKKLSSKFEEYVLPKINDFHSLLYYASLYIGEGATAACEAGALGTPWIFVSTTSRGYLDDQQNNYGLGYVIPDSKLVMKKTFELVEKKDLRGEWKRKREKLLNEKIDVTKFMIWFIEKYPEGFEIMKENPEYQARFR